MIASPREKMARSESLLRDFARSLPETHEDFPWGHRAFKVKKKAFVFMGAEEEMVSLSFKLPDSRKSALQNAFAKPTGYGLGKSGWVSVEFDLGDELPMDLLKSWIKESYCAIAPKKLSEKLAPP
jgi:predicted DNA-binding protein (MmcQ/YjbR family)